MRTTRMFGAALMVSAAFTPLAGAEPLVLWADGQVRCSVVLPDGDKESARIAQDTLSRYLRVFYDLELPKAGKGDKLAVALVIGTPENNPELAHLVADGLRLTTEDLGEEGFQIVTHQKNGRESIVIYGQTPRAVKHGCQELLFFRVSATARRGQMGWPLNVVMKPQLAYRGIYMLPCWSAYDSIDSWKRVLQFNSELTLNRIWFWLDGFPVAGHPASGHGTDYHFQRTPLASDENVQSLIDLVNREAMKFYIGGGWMSWHHWEVVGRDREKARQYYFDYLRKFKGVAGFYFEPTGEGEERADWLPGDSLAEMIRSLLERDPNFEVAVAIGRFNNKDYLKLMSELDPKRVFWWWCWGDPLADKATELYPSVLGWHTTVRMSDIHGTVAPPSASELELVGMSTSYDPGMGFGNPWNGWARMGVYEPRDFDPYTMPYFSHEYKFRERCWNPTISDEDFARRLNVRLFDADMPARSISLYLQLADLCFGPQNATAEFLAEAEAFVRQHEKHGTPRNMDTISRMAEAVRGLRKVTGK
ncbi:MAG TPA: hypothetical protein PLT93_15680 [Phycisphaerae bacterium]|nr:hypothetical protein [Phycisphaerae bacterium]